jgi:hypothetical protein
MGSMPRDSANASEKCMIGIGGKVTARKRGFIDIQTKKSGIAGTKSGGNRAKVKGRLLLDQKISLKLRASIDAIPCLAC